MAPAAKRRGRPRHAAPPAAAGFPEPRARQGVRAQLDRAGARSVIEDVAAGRYSDLQLAAFVTACAGERLDLQETIALTRADGRRGRTHRLGPAPVLDKHCVGGLPGNRTTLIVVAIVAAAGCDAQDLVARDHLARRHRRRDGDVAPVDLDVAAMRRWSSAKGGCIVWGGAVRLSPADDILIRVERPLDLDSRGPAGRLGAVEEVAAGSTHVLIDLPVGPTAKVRSAAAAAWQRFAGAAAAALGWKLRGVQTDGTQPVGRGIGPALEARDVLAVLRNDAERRRTWRKALLLAGQLLEMGGSAVPGMGTALAAEVLADGRAWRKFQDICEAQGAAHARAGALPAWGAGLAQRRVLGIDNRRLARIAKLAGAPFAPGAGIDLHVRVGDFVERGQTSPPAGSPGELATLWTTPPRSRRPCTSARTHEHHHPGPPRCGRAGRDPGAAAARAPARWSAPLPRWRGRRAAAHLGAAAARAAGGPPRPAGRQDARPGVRRRRGARTRRRPDRPGRALSPVHAAGRPLPSGEALTRAAMRAYSPPPSTSWSPWTTTPLAQPGRDLRHP